MAAVRDFAGKFGLMLKALNLSRGRLAQAVGIDKSVVSRWASGATQPSDHNLSVLTAVVTRQRPQFGRLDWDLDHDAFAARLGLASAPGAAELAPADRPSVAVLPFANFGGDTEQEYFADGITEDIITALARWRSLTVIARNSVFTYKGRSVDVREAGRELGARYVLEGSVRRAGPRVRIAAQLIDASSGAHLWADRYDRELTDVFAIQDEISRHIATTVEPELARHEQALSAKKSATDLQSWDLVHRGMYLLYKFTREDIVASRQFFERAIALDPHFSRAHTALAYTYQADLVHGFADDQADTARKLLEYAKCGAELDDTDSFSLLMLSFAYRWNREHDLAVEAARKALYNNPGDAWALGTYALALDLAGQGADCISCFERALALTPRDPHVKFYLALGARSLIVQREYETAIAWARRAVVSDPKQARPHLLIAAALGHLGRGDEARMALDTAERLQPGFASKWVAFNEYRDEASHLHVVEGLHKAGMASLRRLPN